MSFSKMKEENIKVVESYIEAIGKKDLIVRDARR